MTRNGPWEVGIWNTRPTVGQVLEDREAADPVSEDVMENDHQRAAVVGKTGDKCCRPERPANGQPRSDDPGDCFQQSLLVTWCRATYFGHMVGDVEGCVVDPDRPPTPKGAVHQTLPQAWNRLDPVRQLPSKVDKRNRSRCGQFQDGR